MSTTVYRVQNKRNFGPYTGATWDSGGRELATPDHVDFSDWLRMHHADQTTHPGGSRDFEVTPPPRYLYGFTSFEGLCDWFEEPLIVQGFIDHGYLLAIYESYDVRVGISGKQVAFDPGYSHMISAMEFK